MVEADLKCIIETPSPMEMRTTQICQHQCMKRSAHLLSHGKAAAKRPSAMSPQNQGLSLQLFPTAKRILWMANLVSRHQHVLQLVPQAYPGSLRSQSNTDLLQPTILCRGEEKLHVPRYRSPKCPFVRPAINLHQQLQLPSPENN